jgi:hypothetical protein
VDLGEQLDAPAKLVPCEPAPESPVVLVLNGTGPADRGCPRPGITVLEVLPRRSAVGRDRGVRHTGNGVLAGTVVVTGVPRGKRATHGL